MEQINQAELHACMNWDGALKSGQLSPLFVDRGGFRDNGDNKDAEPAHERQMQLTASKHATAHKTAETFSLHSQYHAAPLFCPGMRGTPREVASPGKPQSIATLCEAGMDIAKNQKSTL